MKLKELLFLLSCIIFTVFCVWYAISEFGKSLDGWKPVQVEEIEVNKRAGEIYTVPGRWEGGALVLRGSDE